MKRIISILLALCTVVSLTACGKNITPDETVNAEPEKTAYEKAVEVLGNLPSEPISQNPLCNIFRLTDSGVQVRYIEIDAVTKGTPVNIMQLTDCHFNSLNERDLAENNPTVMSTYENRWYCRDGASVENTLKVMQYADKFDYIAVTGDVIDYLTYGSLELFKEHFWDKYSNLLVTLGNHEHSQQMTGKVAETVPLETRYSILQQYWQHDMYYHSVTVKNSVMLIQMYNGFNKYTADQAEKLDADIKYARENGLTVLIFQHVPFGTGNGKDAYVLPLVMTSGTAAENFYANYICGERDNPDAATKRVYKLVTENADVVRGVFCGHLHADYYVEIPATYTQNGETVETVIPQVVLNQSFNTNGHFLAIMVN